MNENLKYLRFIFSQLEKIRDGLLTDSSRSAAAYHIGILMCSLDLTLSEDKENNNIPRDTVNDIE